MIRTTDERLRFAADEDMLRIQSDLDKGNGNGIWPRVDKSGKPIRTWEKYHQLAMNEIARRFRARKGTVEPFELGRMDKRSQDRFWECAACFALHFLFMDAENTGDPNGYHARRAAYYWDRAGSIFEAESIQVDYDLDRSGTVGENEKSQPFPARVIRG